MSKKKDKVVAIARLFSERLEQELIEGIEGETTPATEDEEQPSSEDVQE